MVSITDISKLISNPSLVGKEHLDTLSDLAKKYPYSQIYSILYLKGLKNVNDIRFEDELLNHSYRISDRVQLYRIIMDQPMTQQEEVSLSDARPEHSSEEILTTIDPQDEVNLSSSEITKEKQVAERQEEFKDEVPFTIESSSQPAQDTLDEENQTKEDSEIELKADFEEEAPEHESESDLLEESILHHAFINAYQLEELTPEEEKQIEVPTEIQKETEETEIVTVQEQASASEKKNSFTEWLKANNNYEERPDDDRRHIKAVVTNFKDFDPSEDLFGEIEKPKREFFSPTKKARESLDENAVPVSETLAKIYALQGNYPKAISAYEQLILINPEKKIFFADQIKELKKKIQEK